MIQLEEIIRSGAMFSGTQPILIDPIGIALVQPCEVPGHDGEACVVERHEEGDKLFVVGSIDEIHRQLEAAEVAATDKLAAIREILDAT